MYITIGPGNDNIADFEPNWYWSSSESSLKDIGALRFFNGVPGVYNKNNISSVRVIRSF